MKNISPFMWRKGLALSATFLFALLIIVSCKKTNKTLGQNNLNQSEILSSGGTDTFSIFTYSVYDDIDSLVTSSSNASILGSYHDPVFGTMNAEIYTQLKLKAFNPNFVDLNGITIDSVVLGMQYSGFYGNSGDQTIEVYEINDALGMSVDSNYFASSRVGSTSPFGQSKNLVAFIDNPFGAGMQPRGVYNLNITNRTVIGNDTVNPQLRIHLDRDLGKRIISESFYHPSTFESNANFFSFFKGLHIKTNNGVQAKNKGGMFYFDLNDTYSKLSIYYKLNGVVQTPYDLLINSETAKFTHMERSHSGTDIANVIADSTLGQVQFYSQSFGTRAIVQMPGLNNIPSNAIIHKATLELPIEYQSGTKYAPSSDLVATIISELGKYAFYSFVTYDSYNKQYVVDLRAYAQAVVNNKIENTGIALSPALFISSVDRIIFNGVKTTNKKKPRLNIVYTEF